MFAQVHEGRSGDARHDAEFLRGIASTVQSPYVAGVHEFVCAGPGCDTLNEDPFLAKSLILFYLLFLGCSWGCSWGLTGAEFIDKQSVLEQVHKHPDKHPQPLPHAISKIALRNDLALIGSNLSLA